MNDDPSLKKPGVYDKLPIQWLSYEFCDTASPQSLSVAGSSHPHSPMKDSLTGSGVLSSTEATVVSRSVSPTFEQAKQTHDVKTISPWKPQSKTGLGRLIYHLAGLRHLFVVEVHTSSSEAVTAPGDSPRTNVADSSVRQPPQDVPVGSRKLRAAAVREFLSRGELRSIAHIAVINHHAGKDIDHIIVPIQSHEHYEHVRNVLKPQRVVLKITKKQKSSASSTDVACVIEKAGRGFRSKGNRHGKDMFDEVQNSERVEEPDDELKYDESQSFHGKDLDRVYWQSLDVFIRHRASRSSRYGLDREFNTVNSWCNIQNFDVHVRHRPTLDQLNNILRLDFDLVPVLPQGTTLSQILLNLFGPAILNSDIKDYLPRIKSALAGLNVRCVYKLVKANTKGGYKMIKAPPLTSRVRQFQIGRLELPGDVEDFLKNGKRYSVHKYFNEHLPVSDQLKYSSLPYAKLSSETLGKEGWIPLELLVVDFPQPLNWFGCIVPELQHAVQKYMKTEGERSLRAMGERFVSSYEEIHFNPDDDSECSVLSTRYNEVVFLPPHPDPRKTLETMEQPERKEDHRRTVPSKIAVVYVRPEDNPGCQELLDDISDRLHNQSLCSSIVVRCTISGYDDLTEVDAVDSPLNAVVSSSPDLLFAMIDKRGRTKSDIQDIVAGIQNLGERRFGFPVVTVTAQHIQALLSQYGDQKRYFPESLRKKINFMRGGSNYLSTMPTSIEGNAVEGAMIVGAHLAHPDTTLNTRLPSIVTVVATKDREGLHYLGSARIQNTFKENNDQSDKRKTTESAIQYLKGIMIERFQAWSDTAQQPPTSLVFYRNGIDFDHPAIEEECKKIEMAWREFYPLEHKPRLTYIVVNKNTEIPSQVRTDKKSPSFGFSDQDGEVPKYQYYVHANDHHFNRDGIDIKDITAAINGNSQLVSHKRQPSYALPIKFAEKLARRVNNYYRSHFKQARNEDPLAIWLRYNVLLGEEDDSNVLISPEATSDMGKGTDKTPQEIEPRPRPWHHKLNEYMFYL